MNVAFVGRLIPPRLALPRPSALVAAWMAFGAAVAGAGTWAALTGDEAEAAWRSAIPSVTVALGAPPANPPATGAPVKAAPPSDHAEPAKPAPASHGKPAEPAPAQPGTPATSPAPKMAEAQKKAEVAGADPNAPVTLTPAPAAGLVEDTRTGPLPRIASDGRKPWQVYARPFPAAVTKPRIAIVMSDLGVSGVTTASALERLPGAVTFAFVPQAERLDAWVERARDAGHEVLLSLPAEPIDYPRNDPGANALFTMLKAERNLERLEASLVRAVGYIGVTTTTGTKFTTNARALQPVLEALHRRGLLFFDAKVAPDSVAGGVAAEIGVATASAERTIDRDLARASIDEQLSGLEAAAKAHGSAVGLAFPYPNTIERIALWAVGLPDRGIVLAPLSAVASPGRDPAPAQAASAAPAKAAAPAAGHAPSEKGH